MSSEHVAYFYEMAIILALASAAGIIGAMLRQPLLVAFIIAGILAGPSGFDLIRSTTQLTILADIGVSLLLFLVGLKLDIQIIRSLGRVSVATGLGQVIFTSAVGFLACRSLGYDNITSLYVAVALTFSSTIIIVKLLTDKREVDSLHGRIAVGFLIVQDIVVVVAMVALSSLGVDTTRGPAQLGMPMMLAGSMLFLGLVWLFIKVAAEPLLKRIARHSELLVVFALTWAVVFAATGDRIGVGKELGGLLAGISLASTSYRDAIASRLASLRDFLLLFFFLMLGSRLDLALLGNQMAPAILLSLFVLIGNPLIVLIIMGALGYRKRTGFLAGLTVAQISEFSLVFIAMGMALGHVGEAAVGLVTLVGLVTITLSTYMIIYSHELYSVLRPALGLFERRNPFQEQPSSEAKDHFDMILFGLGRYGSALGTILRQHGVRVLGVDFDPEALARWKARGLPGVFGDATDPEFAASLPLDGVSCAIIATPPPILGTFQEDTRTILRDALKEAGFSGRVAMRSHDTFDGENVTSSTDDIVLAPFSDAAERAAEILELDRGRLALCT